MKKRLRKKKHLGEFTQYGFRVEIQLVPNTFKADEEWCYGVLEFAELHNLTIGGAFRQDSADFVVERIQETRRGGRPWWKSVSATEADRKLFAELFAQKNVERLEIGPLRDVWHDEFGY
jgi:uncharacterized protein YggL (DUF469 family)